MVFGEYSQRIQNELAENQPLLPENLNCLYVAIATEANEAALVAKKSNKKNEISCL